MYKVARSVLRLTGRYLVAHTVFLFLFISSPKHKLFRKLSPSSIITYIIPV